MAKSRTSRTNNMLTGLSNLTSDNKNEVENKISDTQKVEKKENTIKTKKKEEPKKIVEPMQEEKKVPEEVNNTEDKKSEKTIKETEPVVNEKEQIIIQKESSQNKKENDEESDGIPFHLNFIFSKDLKEYIKFRSEQKNITMKNYVKDLIMKDYEENKAIFEEYNEFKKKFLKK